MRRRHTLSIQQVAIATGLTEHTLRYYERIGLIHPISRARNGHRRYSADDTRWIEFLNRLRITGMSIQDMQQYAELYRNGEHTIAERATLLNEHLTRVQEELQQIQDNLEAIHYRLDHYQSRMDASFAVAHQ